MKTYAAKSSAVRAAKKAGLEHYEIIEQDGQFGFRPIEAEDASEGEALEAMEQERDEAQNPDAPEVQADAPVVIPEEPTEPEEPTGPVDAAEAGDAIAESTAKPDNIVRKSSVERPTKKVWGIAEAMFATNPDTRRKDVVAECVRQGIAFYTARTQYQVWSQLQKETKAAAETK